MLSPGDQIDRYVVERLLGVGGAAQVWQVRHHLLGRRYALKVLSPGSSAPGAPSILLAEGRAQAHLEHPNVLPIRDVFPVQGRLALLMPLIEGPSLRRLLHHMRLPEAEALALVRGILGGLSFIHDRDIVHCDLKPENILLRLDDTQLVPCIADFGLARSPEEASGLHHQLGTPGYVAPEQLLSGQPVDRRADLFSMGALLFELLVGHPVFPRETLELARQRRLPPDLSALPPSFRPLVGALLQADPALRPPDCAAILAQLPDAGRGAVLSPRSESYRQALQLRLPEHPSLQTDSPGPSSPPEAGLHNLARAPDRFLGREAEQEEIAAWLARGVRLLSILGIGGVGKSRLAQHVLRKLLPRFPGGVWCCDLSAVTSVAGIFSVLAQVLHVELEDDPIARIGDALRRRQRTLLLLDNLEDLLAEVAPLLPRWLEAVPEVTFLVTSRIPLQLPEESRLLLGPMDTEDGLALFVQRAQARGTALDLAGAAADVRALVAYLDGLPLAIALAASRASLLSPRELLQRLQMRPGLLHGRTSAPPHAAHRQRSLQDVLSWSWSHVSAPARHTLAQLSILEGSFSLSLAEAIVACSTPEGAFWLEDVLSELLDASLLQVQRLPGEERRLLILASVRRFAAEQLSPEALHGVQTRLIAHCHQRLPVGQELRELPHILMASSLAQERHGGAAWSLVQRAHYLLMVRGPFQAAADLLTQAESFLGAADDAAQMHLEGCRMWTLRAQGQHAAAHAAGLRSLALAERLGHTRQVELLQESFALLLREQGDLHGAATRMRSYLDAPRSARAQAKTRLNLSNVLRELGQYDEALAHLADVQAHFPKQAAINQGAIDAERGHLYAAREHFSRGLQLDHAEPSPHGEAVAHQNLAEVLILMGQLQEAAHHLRSAHQIAHRIGHRSLRAGLLATEGLLHLAEDRLPSATTALRDAIEISTSLRNFMQQSVYRSELAVLLCLQSQLQEARVLGQLALARALAQPTARTPLIAARAAIASASVRLLEEARQSLALSPPPVTPQDHITWAMARAVLLREEGGDTEAREAIRTATEALLRTEYSLRGPLGCFLQNLFPACLVSTEPLYIRTEPRPAG